MNSMSYKGYQAHIEYDDDDNIFVGHLAGIRDIVSFHGVTVDELRLHFHEATDHYLAGCKARDEQPQKPYPDNLMLQISPDIHASIATAAQVQGKSVNQWVAKVLSEAACV